MFGDSLEHLLDGGGVSNEGDGHFETFGRDIANSGFDVVGDPLDEVGVVLGFDVEHLFVDFLGGHSSSEDSGGSEVSSVSGVRCAHHVLGVEHLLSELRDGEGSVLLGSSGGQRSESNHEEVETDEGNQVDSKFSQVGIELTGESQGAGDSGHDGGNEMVQISVGGGGQFEGSEADVIEGFVIDDHDLVGRVDQQMN